MIEVKRRAIVLMNLGGPTSLEGVESFLHNIFADPDVIQLPLGFLWQKRFARMLSSRRAAESQENYRKIGGGSPIVELTRAQGDALEAALGPGYRCYVAMRHSPPSTEEAVDALVADGAEEVVALPLYPQRSRSTSFSSVKELRRVLAEKAPNLPLREICCFPAVPGFLDAWATNVIRTLEEIPAERRSRAHVLFSAHGLPQKLVDSGDPYEAHVKASVAGVMARLPPGLAHSLAYQSRATRVKWLEPATEDELARLAEAGIEDVVVVPIAFVTEHVETLFELDMLLKEPALEAGIRGYHRVPVPQDSPQLIDALAELVRNAVHGIHAPCVLPPDSRLRCPRRGADRA